jgi:hypothetical protein
MPDGTNSGNRKIVSRKMASLGLLVTLRDCPAEPGPFSRPQACLWPRGNGVRGRPWLRYVGPLIRRLHVSAYDRDNSLSPLKILSIIGMWMRQAARNDRGLPVLPSSLLILNLNLV